MRPIARQSARLANSNWTRQSSSPNRRNCQQKRTFHASVQLSQDPRPPNGQSHHHTPFNEWREQHKSVEYDPAKQEESTQDARKPGAWRGFRQKRVNDVPKPPPIPDWFLEHNVKLLRDSPGLGVSKENGKVIRCVDAETGHTLFTVPYYDAWPASSQNEKQDSARERRKQAKHEQPAGADMASSAEAASQSQRARNKAKESFDQHFFDPKFQMSKPSAPQQRPQLKETDSPADPAFLENASRLEPKSNPMRWVFLEAETSAQAALSLPSENQRSTSFTSDRVDISLQCPDSNSHDQMDEFVRDLARIVEADLIRLDVNDFAELTSEYVGHGHDEPGSYSTLAYDVYDGYKANALAPNPFRTEQEEDDDNEMDEDDEADEDEHEPPRGNDVNNSIFNLNKAISIVQGGGNRLGNALRRNMIPVEIGFVQNGQRHPLMQQPPRSSGQPPNRDTDRDDARLAALLDQLLDAPKQKHATSKPSDDTSSSQRRAERRKLAGSKDETDEMDRSYQRILRYWRSNPAFWLPETAKSLVGYLGKALQEADSKPAFTLSSESKATSDNHSLRKDSRPRTIVHVRDLQDICNSSLGDSIIHRLVKVVRKRRRSGERILIVGTTAQDVRGPFRMPGEQLEEFRTITVPPFFNFSITDDSDFEANSNLTSQKSLSEPAYRRILEINCRHIQNTFRTLRPDDKMDLMAATYQVNLPGMHFLTEKVLPLDQVQRLALIATGLSELHAKSDTVAPIHVALAGFVMTQSDHAEESWVAFKERKQVKKFKSDFENVLSKDSAEEESTQARVDRLKKICNSHETRLLSGMVDPQNIKTAFADVHAPAETIEALKTLTTLSLLRPDAFKYGVLANDRLPGLLLYGPPGTGKTLLAKAVAKESKAAVLEVSGAQIYEKYVGEGEKMVRAVFSLAKKLSPCVVFIDEADAIFGSRGHAGNRNTHREIINQFLREWDGMDDHSVFMMVATNRPFDLDDAVLRRLPRRLLVDLPVAKDRESILGIHLKNESLDSSVSLSKLAEQTPLYSGSDLKNLSVAAALACVREENEFAEANKDDTGFKLPDKRVLTSKHFDKALAEISASISEDMSSLTAIRKFDEQYGDRKGRRKKTGYGFGMDNDMIDEGAARVRTPPPS